MGPAQSRLALVSTLSSGLLEVCCEVFSRLQMGPDAIETAHMC